MPRVPPERVQISLLGRFAVRVGDVDVPDRAWVRRSASSLVKLLALTPDRALHRDRVLDALWPGQPAADAAPRLHTAAHYARRALGDRAAVLLGGEQVRLFPDADVRVDVDEFAALARTALEGADPAAAGAALDRYCGDLLPEDLFEPWTEPERGRLRQLEADLLRTAHRWAELLVVEPADEQAHLALMRDLAARGDRRGALRQFERLARALRTELGVGPSREALALRDRLAGGEATSAPAQRRLIGRGAALARLDRALHALPAGRGGAVAVCGPPGVGVSAVLAWARGRAAGTGVRTGAGAASAETGWPYAPVLEALGDLCRRHPELLEELDEAYRAEIQRALRGGDAASPGPAARQRLFVSVAELLRLAAGSTGVVLTLDDLDDADDDSLRLVHYLVRGAPADRVLLVLGQPPPGLLPRGGDAEVRLAPLSAAGTAALIAEQLGGPGDPGLARDVHALSGGLPGRVLELVATVGRAGGLPLATLLASCPPGTEEALRRVAVAGAAADTDEFVALSGAGEAGALAALDAALAAGLLETGEHGYRLRPARRAELLDPLPPQAVRRLHREVADALAAGGAAAARVGRHLLAAGSPRAAAPHLLTAAEQAAGVGAYRDALALLEPVGDAVGGADRARFLALRAELLHAVSDPGAIAAYRVAADAAGPADRRMLLVRLARAAERMGDRETAAEAIADLEPDGGPADAALLLARGAAAYHAGDLAGARAAIEEARRRLDGAGDWLLQDLTLLQGMIAHDRGEWFQRLRHELEQTRATPALATVVFDGHLCVAEYLLYGPTPYDEVIELGSGLRATADRAGAPRALAFAAALTGEAALLAGDLDRAERELAEAVEVHRRIRARAGEAHSLQRLAELRLHQGRREEARELLRRALPLARWSPLAAHLLQRVHGTAIAAADTPEEAYAALARAEAISGVPDTCPFCDVLIEIPATIACADVGDLEAARRHLARAEWSTRLYPGTSLQAGVVEARAHLVRAEGDGAWRALLAEAAEQFAGAGQPLDAARCRAAVAEAVPLPR